MDSSWTSERRIPVLVIAAGLPLVWCAVAGQLRGNVSAATDALVLVLVVVGAATSADRLTGMLAALSGGVWFDYFLVPPLHRFTIDDPNNVEVTLLLVLVGVAVTEIVLWGRRQQASASTRAGYLDGIMATSKIVAGALSSTELEVGVAAHLRDLLAADAVRFVAGSTIPANRPVLGPDGEVTIRGTRVNVARDGMPTLDETALPTTHHGKAYGQFLVTTATEVSKPSLEQRQVAVLLANQVGAARATSPGLV